MDRPGTPWRFTSWKKRGNWPSIDIWCRDRAQPMIALSAESASATMSMTAMIQLSASPLAEKILPANVTNIVFGSTRSGFDSALDPSTATKPSGMRV